MLTKDDIKNGTWRIRVNAYSGLNWFIMVQILKPHENAHETSGSKMNNGSS